MKTDYVQAIDRVNFITRKPREPNEIKSWLQKHIDYWEGEFEKTSFLPEEEKEYEGMLSAFYMVQEFIDGQRR